MDKKFNFIGRNKTGKDNTSSFFLLPSSFVKAHSAFTIVELLVVVAIIGVLLGIVTTAVTGSMKTARRRRADAMCKAFEQAISTYRVQEGKWPVVIETRANNIGDKPKYTFTADEGDGIWDEIIDKSVGENASRPLIDVAALFVADKGRVRGDGCFDNHSDKTSGSGKKSSYCGDQHCISGIGYMEAVRRGKPGRGNMVFGWQGVQNGKFCRFWVTYNAMTDSVKVSRSHPQRSYPSDWE